MPDETIEAEQEQIVADSAFVQSSSGISIASAESTGRSARAVVLLKLIEGPMAPQDLSKSTDLSTEQAIQALNELHTRNLLEILVPKNDSGGPIFSVLPRGEKAAMYIQTG
jgi:hypothetical protein